MTEQRATGRRATDQRETPERTLGNVRVNGVHCRPREVLERVVATPDERITSGGSHTEPPVRV